MSVQFGGKMQDPIYAWETRHSKHAPSKQAEAQEFLSEQVFVGLKDRNTGFDAECIPHFSPQDFLIVVERLERLGANMYGIEVFDEEHRVDICEIRPMRSRGLAWARRVIKPYVG